MKLFTTGYTVTHPGRGRNRSQVRSADRQQGPRCRGSIRSRRSPDIKIVAYQIVAEEPGSAPGPGNAVLMNATRWSNVGQDPWLITARRRHCRDPVRLEEPQAVRLPEKRVWKDSFRDLAPRSSRPTEIDGLFFDNCKAPRGEFHQPANPAALTTRLQRGYCSISQPTHPSG